LKPLAGDRDEKSTKKQGGNLGEGRGQKPCARSRTGHGIRKLIKPDVSEDGVGRGVSQRGTLTGVLREWGGGDEAD